MSFALGLCTLNIYIAEFIGFGWRPCPYHMIFTVYIISLCNWLISWILVVFQGVKILSVSTRSNYAGTVWFEVGLVMLDYLILFLDWRPHRTSKSINILLILSINQLPHILFLHLTIMYNLFTLFLIVALHVLHQIMVVFVPLDVHLVGHQLFQFKVSG